MVSGGQEVPASRMRSGGGLLLSVILSSALPQSAQDKKERRKDLQDAFGGTKWTAASADIAALVVLVSG
jgi:hypothetical protein